MDGASDQFYKALRATIEKFAGTARFIGTCNYINKVPEPVQSRFTCISFDFLNKEEEKKGIMALYYQSIERLIQETSIKYLIDNKNFKLEDIVPCQDGFMILKELYNDNLLNEIEEKVFNTFNIKVKFANKPFDEAIEIPYYEENIASYDEWVDILCTKNLAERFIKEYNNLMMINDTGIYIYYKNKWYNETDKDKRYKLMVIISENLYELTKKEINVIRMMNIVFIMMTIIIYLITVLKL
jgi:hypothetical protein